MGYLRGAELGGALNAEAFLSQLDTLVGDLYENDLNLYPDTVALVWWLAAQAQDLAERNQEGTGDRSPFLQVVNQTYTQWKNQEGELSSLGRRLRKVLEQQG
ncbi:MAG TPA: hypothetical protein VK464_22070 [Symbiobacteriaceae bacterium]|jgi:hypothetical protein|nr:hypothetical protein [Symbiobacteriaceae bacterium]